MPRLPDVEPADDLTELMPLFTPPGVLLDVTLRRDGEVRRWTINQPMLDEGWTCRRVTTQGVTMSGCTTKEEVMAKVREWQLEIEAAKADGWT